MHNIKKSKPIHIFQLVFFFIFFLLSTVIISFHSSSRYFSLLCEPLAIDEIDRVDEPDDIEPIRVITDASGLYLLLVLLFVSFDCDDFRVTGKNTK